jgi:hypothetical protein
VARLLRLIPDIQPVVGWILQESSMASPLFEAGCTLAVLLGLYGFLCYWEASRADLMAGVRRHQVGAANPEAPRYRARARVALAASGAIAIGLFTAAL